MNQQKCCEREVDVDGTTARAYDMGWRCMSGNRNGTVVMVAAERRNVTELEQLSISFRRRLTIFFFLSRCRGFFSRLFNTKKGFKQNISCVCCRSGWSVEFQLPDLCNRPYGFVSKSFRNCFQFHFRCFVAASRPTSSNIYDARLAGGRHAGDEQDIY